MNLWIGNISPNVTDDELTEFVVKYGCPQPAHIDRVLGNGSRPAAVLSFENGNSKLIFSAQSRLHGLYWKNRQLNVQTLRRWGKQ